MILDQETNLTSIRLNKYKQQLDKTNMKYFPIIYDISLT
jgi:hypothetical protein